MKTFTQDEPIIVRAAEEFELSLPGKGAQGYEWDVADVTPGLTFLGHAPPEDRAEDTGIDDQMGADFPERLRFRADRPGTFTVCLVCRRAFGDTTAISTLTLPVSVHRGT